MSIKDIKFNDIKSMNEISKYLVEYEISDFFNIKRRRIINDNEEERFVDYYEFKEDNINKDIVGLNDNLEFESKIPLRDSRTLYKYKSGEKEFVVKINTDFNINDNIKEVTINLYLNSLQNEIKSIISKSLYFLPPILKVFYNNSTPYRIMFNEKYRNTISFIKRNEYWIRIQFIFSLLYIISAKLIFLQKNLNFTHNDLKLDNIVWSKKDDNVIDFYLIDFETCRIQAKNDTEIIGENTFGVKSNLLEGKDMFCLIHSILFELKKKNLEYEYLYFNDLFDNFGLEINHGDFIHPKEKISELPISKQESLRKKYGNLAYYRNDLIPYFLTYILDEYPENFSPKNIFENIKKYIETEQLENTLIDKGTILLAQDYFKLSEQITINNDSGTTRKYLINY